MEKVLSPGLVMISGDILISVFPICPIIRHVAPICPQNGNSFLPSNGIFSAWVRRPGSLPIYLILNDASRRYLGRRSSPIDFFLIFHCISMTHKLESSLELHFFNLVHWVHRLCFHSFGQMYVNHHHPRFYCINY